jgi:hypothetical protein
MAKPLVVHESKGVVVFVHLDKIAYVRFSRQADAPATSHAEIHFIGGEGVSFKGDAADEFFHGYKLVVQTC